MESNKLNYFILNCKGERTAKCFGYYNGGKEAAEKACKVGETVSEGRACPYPGCYGSEKARPPCGLCYE